MLRATRARSARLERACTPKSASEICGVSGRRALDRADALVRVAESFLSQSAELPARRGDERAEIVLHLENDRLSEDGACLGAHLEDGAHVPAETLRRVACDCALRPILVDASGSPLDVGRRRRAVPRRLRRALLVRDRCCRFPGCAHRAWLDAHHVEHWLHGGPTDLENLVLLCPAHHRLVHEGGFTIAVEEGAPIVRAPNGRPLPAHVPPRPAPLDPLDAFRVSAETELDDETLLPWWDGAPPDVRACVDAARSRLA